MLDVDSCHDHGGTYHSGEDPFDGRRALAAENSEAVASDR